MYGNGYSMAIVLDHRSTATSLTGNPEVIHMPKTWIFYGHFHMERRPDRLAWRHMMTRHDVVNLIQRAREARLNMI